MIDHGKLIALADQIGLSAETAQANSGSVNWRTLRRYEEALRAIANPAPAPQQMTTQGEAVATVVESLANGHALEFHGGYSETLDALPIGTKLYTGSQP